VWKRESPTFLRIVDDIEKAFNITANATRINIYGGASGGHSADYKPFHYDMAATTPGLSRNITVTVSFGAERELAFKHTKKKLFPESKWPNIHKGTTVGVMCGTGSVYSFGRDVNCEIQHSLLEGVEEEDRISVVVWGTGNFDTRTSRVSKRATPTADELGIRLHNRVEYSSTN
jgi:hypothetical protein